MMFAYNERSILSKSYIRVGNTILFALILLAGIENKTQVIYPFWSIVAIPFIIGILSAITIEQGVKRTEFYEWDYTERKKKSRFIVIYSMISIIICSFFTLSCFTAVYLIEEKMDLLQCVFYILPSVFFAFQIPNIINLYYPIFKDDLTLGYKVQKKPDNWKDNGREIKDEDEIAEIMHRDFGV